MPGNCSLWFCDNNVTMHVILCCLGYMLWCLALMRNMTFWACVRAVRCLYPQGTLLTDSFADCGRERPGPAKFFPSSKKAAVMEQKRGLSSMPGVMEAVLSAHQDLLLGEISKALLGVEKRRWFAVSSLSTITLQQSKANGSLEPQGYLAKS